ncbi:MAG: App1 family protein [Pirellulales bacterium]
MHSPRHSWIALAASMLFLANLAWAMKVTDPQSPIDDDERVVFFPTAAHRSADGTEWIVPIHGWVFEPRPTSRKRAALLGTLRVAWGLDRDSAETEVFRRRAWAFLVDNERGQRIAVQIAGHIEQLPPSQPNGHFRSELRLPADGPGSPAAATWLPHMAVMRPLDGRQFRGEALLLDDEGVSVVSDIDDTVKISEVRNRQVLMRRTFLQEFEAAPGMARLYQSWQARGASFHYVTAAPWQLYEPLSEFLTQQEFPRGTFDMKDFRLKDSTIRNLWADADTLKRQAIEPLLARFPRRRFILVGDSGERDPEIYGHIARAHPQQVMAIFIRDVTGEPSTHPRYTAAFAELPNDMWRIFADPAVLDDWRWPDP